VINFGKYVKSLRIERSLTLREFCRITHLDPGNWSKIERGILSPPKSREDLNTVAEALALSEGSDEHNTLFELAAISFIPPELTDQNVLEKLPVFFRTVRGEKPTRKELEELIRILREA
jgi:transcriptional regulator with XRE-family HTH domain